MLWAYADAGRRTLAQPFGDESLKQPRHVENKGNEASFTTSDPGATLLENEPAKTMERLIIVTEPVVEPAYALSRLLSLKGDRAGQRAAPRSSSRLILGWPIAWRLT